MNWESSNRNLAALMWIGILAAILVAAYWSVRLAYADYYFRKGTPAALDRAVQILPSYDRYHLSNAIVKQQVQPTSPEIEHEFAAALRLNERNSEALMGWGLTAELAGDSPRAEALFVEATQVDKLIKPVWTLANFYFRQGDTAKFLPAARQCLRMMSHNGVFFGGYNPASMYDLCWNATDDPHRIFTELIPHDRDILYSYFGYLLNRDRMGAAAEVADTILADPFAYYLPGLLVYCESLIRDHRIPEVVNLWRKMAAKNLIPYRAVDLEQGVFLTNGDFRHPILQAGFDWRNLAGEPVVFSYLPEQNHLRYQVDGGQPEHVPLLSQCVPVVPGKKYRMTARFDAPSDPAFRGFTWKVQDQRSGEFLPTVTKVYGGSYSLAFDARDTTEAVNLILGYDRLPGTARARGVYEIESVSLHSQAAGR
jgi:tetratricopeptide (TPR) repeat protein